MMSLNALQWHVMDATADDWESIVQIRPHVTQFCGHRSDGTIFDVLRNLHQHGLVRLMDRDGYAADIFPDDPSDFWFSMTEAGRKLWDAEGSKYRGEGEDA
ncbi:MAG: hypothetical protein SYC29_15895 [Planctomycetota bacterium]|nr:hypothetical protein [Planctomycetota bacterium]